MDLIIFIVSFVAAFVFSLGGVGAAIVLIPAMIFLGVPLNVAKPVGLFYNTISLTGASINNIKHKRLDFKITFPVIAVSFLFAIAGAYLSSYLPSRWIMMLFIGFLLFSGFMFLFYKSGRSETYKDSASFVLLLGIGAIAGMLSGILGVGGGGIISPLMLMLGFHPKKIAALTAFVVPFSSFAGFLAYWSLGSVDWVLLLTVSVAGVVGATLGTVFMHQKMDAKSVKKILALILLAIAIKLIFKCL